MAPGRPATGPGHYLRDIIYGALDGVITTLAVVSAVEGAHLAASIVIVLGLANLGADGLSMAASNYLGMKSELEQRGDSVDDEKPLRHGAATFAAFVAAGAIPLSAYVLPFERPFVVAGLLAAATVFGVGAARATYTGKRALTSGAEMLAIGGLAAAAAYAIGAVAQAIIA